MCGLVGVFGQIGAKEDKVMKQLLILDAIRGEHSTGVLNVTSAGVGSVLKKMGGPSELAQYKAYDKMFNKVNRVLMGHNRWATQGEINHENAHPFEFDTLVGAHNGTLRNQHALPNSREFDVDSENLYHAIEQDGLHTTIKKVNGAFSLTWYNKVDKTLNFLRNSERPMCMCLSADGKTLFWASEQWMLEVALGKNQIRHGDIIETDVGYQYSYNIEDYSWKNGVPKPRITKVPLYVATVITTKSYKAKGNGVKKPPAKNHFTKAGEIVTAKYFGQSHSKVASSSYIIMKSEGLAETIRVYTPHGSNVWDMLAGSDDGEKFTVRLGSFVPHNTNQTFSYYRAINDTLLPEKLEGHEKKKLTRVEWNKATKGGCCCCADPIESPSEVGDWFDADSPVCKECLADYSTIEQWLSATT